MNEITRIHLAKTPYEIEVPAKKDLAQYLKSLASYAYDAEVIEDIEIRMTEILATRGVQSGGVIGASDVKALKAQIGSPEEVAGEEPAEGDRPTERKLYRDTDRGMVGGVVSGLAAYFRVDATLARIIFIVLTFITSGFLLIVYLLMWFVVPAAKTAADKLRLRGRLVTAESIATVNSEDTVSSKRRGEIIRLVLLYAVGAAALLGAVVSLLAVGAATISAFTEGLFNNDSTPPMWYAAYGLAVVSGLLLTSLFGLVAYASFRRDLSKRLVVAGVAVIIAGIISFSAAVGFGMLGAWQSQQDLQSSIKQTQLSLPDDFQDIKSVSFSSDTLATIEYVVEDRASMSLESTAGFTPDIKVKDGQAEISLHSDGRTSRYTQSTLRVSGPALDRLVVEAGSLSYTADKQDSLAVEVASEANLVVAGGIDNLEAIAEPRSYLQLAEASIGDVKLDIGPAASVQIGNVRSLDVSHSDVCPTDGHQSTLEVNNVAYGELKLNDQTRSLRSYDLACFQLDYEPTED